MLYRMRRGKIGSQLGTDQKYYVSQCEEKKSIQLTITVVGDDKEHINERRNLIEDVKKYLKEIMGMIMPASDDSPLLLIPCELCSPQHRLHVSLDDVRSGKAIYCPHKGDKRLSCGYYGDLWGTELTGATNNAGKAANCCKFIYILTMNSIQELTQIDLKD